MSSTQRVTEYYGSHVFSLKAMAKRLSSRDLEIITTASEKGGKIDEALADRIANAAQEWATEKGATHYCHWFQPQTGSTAEKHDAFLAIDKNGFALEKLTGRQLLQSEPDASSFPSGGRRSTFEARGYTGWDPSSPMFILENGAGKTLYIPSVFISYNGEALDFKLPLLRANEVLSKVATQTLNLLGNDNVTRVDVGVGAEQEFFAIDLDLARQRPDLMAAGRSVLGCAPHKGQELEDHYFGHIPTRIQKFINEVEVEMYKLGVPLKTRHNEVAPAQFEIAPIFETANIAADHNHLLMKVLHTVSEKHNLKILFHEKPFAGVNGSGKHVNWSMIDSKGRNLLDPGTTPHQNIIFLTVIAGVMQGIYDHAVALRAAIASAGNDHRLGANEAPPAIISVFMGSTLDHILTAIEKGEIANVSAEEAMIELNVSHLQEVLKDNTDRNRTSPFAFTGNKFEFRAVGSSAAIAYPTTILNAAAASGLAKINAKLSALPKVTPESVLQILGEVFTQTRAVRFEGNGYSDAWKQDAESRGLRNLVSSPAALQGFYDKKEYQFLIDTNVFTEADVESRIAIQLDRYVKQQLIEANLALSMARTSILPAAISYLTEVGVANKACMDLSLGQPCSAIAEQLAFDVGELSKRTEELSKTLNDGAKDHDESVRGLIKQAQKIQQDVLPKIAAVRASADALEKLVAHQRWPFPKYSEILFAIE